MREYSLEFRIQVVRRILDGEKVPQLSQELGIHRKVLYEWKRRVLDGGESNLKKRGRPRTRDAGPPRTIVELERTIAHQQRVIEFFGHALPRTAKSRQMKIAPGATASSNPSKD